MKKIKLLFLGVMTYFNSFSQDVACPVWPFRDLPSSESFYVPNTPLYWEAMLAINPIIAIGVLTNSPYSNPCENWYSEINTSARAFTGDLMFSIGNDYNLSQVHFGRWSEYSSYWNKIMAIKTTQDDGSMNSIRIGYRYRPELSKMELGFYAHFNHLQDNTFGGDISPGRELQL